jgi:hypothetical protein
MANKHRLGKWLGHNVRHIVSRFHIEDVNLPQGHCFPSIVEAYSNMLCELGIKGIP